MSDDRLVDPSLPPEFRDPDVLRFVAQILVWREGDPLPPMPPGVTEESLPDILAKLNDPEVRRAVAVSLSHRRIDPDREP